MSRMGRHVRVYQSALAGVVYVYGRPIPFPIRRSFEKPEQYDAVIKEHDAARQIAVDREEVLTRLRRERAA